MNHLIKNSSHPLIPREQTYNIDRKLVTIHTEDRDINKWSESNHFELRMPEPLQNVESIRLVEIMLPANYYTFSDRSQNTKFWLTCNGITREVVISNGFYSNPEELAAELAGSINDQAWGGPVFDVIYNSVTQKFWFTEINSNKFSLDFDRQSFYDISNCPQNIVFGN